MPQVIKIYLASSPDLIEERRFVSEVLEQLNRSKAAEQNVTFELVSAEDPDKEEVKIREDVRIATSDLFVLLVWKHLDQPLSESLAEKFSFAQGAFKYSNRPHLLTYFRSVSPSMMADPGERLQQVISFRNHIEENNYQFFRYDYPLQWRELFLDHLTRWLDSRAEAPGVILWVPQVFPPSLAETLYLRLQGERASIVSPMQQHALTFAREAISLATEGKLTLAEAHFSKALELNENPEVLHSFGVFLRELGSLGRAETIFKRLLTKSLAEEDIKPIYQSLAFTNLGLLYATRAAKKPIVIGSGITGWIMARLLAEVHQVTWIDLKDSSSYLGSISSPKNLAYGLATAFRSRETDPFGELVSQLYRYSTPQSRVEVLQTLISNVGGKSGVAKLAKQGGVLSELRGLVSLPTVTVPQTSEVAPETVGVLATHAEQKNPFTIDKVSRVYSSYPEVIKHLGPKPLTIALSSMAEREAVNPRKTFFLNRFSEYGDVKLHGALDASVNEDTAAEPPHRLFANSWFEDEYEVLDRQTSLIAGNSYYYCFSIERVRRLLLGWSHEFSEPLELARGVKQQVQLEVVCPLLDMKSRRGVMRRRVAYYSGNGIRTQAFPLKPQTAGDYSLITRVFYGCRLLYRAILPLKVIGEFPTGQRPADHSAANEISVR